MLLVGLLSLLHEAIKLKLLQVVAFGTLLGVHRRVFDRREHDIVFLLPICELNLCRLWFSVRAQVELVLAEGNSLGLADLLVEFNHVSLCIFRVTLTLLLLIDEDLSPERILAHVYPLLRLK